MLTTSPRGSVAVRLLSPVFRPLAVAMGIGLSLATASVAHADPILTFGQAVAGAPVVATNYVSGGVNHTKLAATGLKVVISQFGLSSTPFNAYLNLNLLSTANAVVTNLGAGGMLYTEAFSGTANFTQFANGTGKNYLSTTFLNTVLGFKGASSLTLSASNPPATNVTFTSTELPGFMLQDTRSIAFSFAGVTPVLGLVGTGTNVTLKAFHSSISGTVSSGFVPEPASLALIGTGLFGVVMLRRRTRRPSAAAA